MSENEESLQQVLRSKSIDELHPLKKNLELAIKEAINQFQDATGLHVKSLNLLERASTSNWVIPILERVEAAIELK